MLHPVEQPAVKHVINDFCAVGLVPRETTLERRTQPIRTRRRWTPFHRFRGERERICRGAGREPTATAAKYQSLPSSIKYYRLLCFHILQYNVQGFASYESTLGCVIWPPNSQSLLSYLYSSASSRTCIVVFSQGRRG